MRDKINNWIEEALQYKKKEPTDAVSEVIKKHADEINTEHAKRIVEGYNVRSFQDKQASGYDMERSFPLADFTKISAGYLKDTLESLSKKASHSGFHEPPDLLAEYHNDHLANTERSMQKRAYFEPKSESIQIELDDGPVKFAAFKLCDYLNRFDDCYRYNDRFVSELRYLNPDSRILKEAGLSDGETHMPMTIKDAHEEFSKYDEIFGILKKKIVKMSAAYDPLAGMTPVQRGNIKYRERLSDIKKNDPDYLIPDPAYIQATKDVSLAKSMGRIEESKGKSEASKAYADSQNAEREKIERQREQEKERQNTIAKQIDMEQKKIEGKTLDSEIRKMELDVEKSRLEGQRLKPEIQKQLNDLKKETEKEEERAKPFPKRIEKFVAERVNPYLDFSNVVTGDVPLALFGSEEKGYGGYPVLRHARERIYDPSESAYGKLLSSFGKGISPMSYFGNLSSINSPLSAISPENQDQEQFLIESLLPGTQNLSSYIAPDYKKNTENMLRLVKRKANFETLLQNDEVLKSADPNLMLKAYENFTKIAPEAMLVKDIARQLLRAVSAQGSTNLDPNTIVNLRKMDAQMAFDPLSAKRLLGV